MDFKYIYAYNYRNHNDFIDIRNKLIDAGFRATLMLDIPDEFNKYAVIFKYKDEYYIQNSDYNSIESEYLQIIYTKGDFIRKSINLINKKENMDKNNIEIVTITFDRYNSLQNKSKANDKKIEELANKMFECLKKDLELKIGMSIEFINNNYKRTNKSIAAGIKIKDDRINLLEEFLETNKKEKDELENKYNNLKIQHEMLKKKYQKRKENYVELQERYNKLVKSKWYNFNWLK